MGSLSGRLGAEDSHMETITQLQETDLLSAHLLVWRRENGGRGHHAFSCTRGNLGLNEYTEGLWSAPIPGGFTMVSADDEVSLQRSR